MIDTCASYRLQLQPAFGFDAAAALVPYLARLGVSQLYVSPMFQAVAGSTHGYDVVNPAEVSEELGGAAGRGRLVTALDAHGIGLIADIVPNHMALQGNAWWSHVLEHGTASRYFAFFDLAEDADLQRPHDGIVIPVLGEPYGMELDAGRLALVVEAGRVLLAYGAQRFPLSPESAADLVGGGTDQRVAPGAALDVAVARVNADTARLHALLERQHYRLAWWRLARDESAYRRFFDVNSLIGMRVDRQDVFDATHRLVAEWVNDGSVQGLRVDHVDGLSDPGRYLARLRGLAPTQWIGVEKILAVDEELPAWPVDGTTGYEFGALVTRLLTDAGAEAPLTTCYERFTGLTDTFAEVAEDARHEVLGHWLSGDARRLALLLYAQCQDDIHLRDYSLRDTQTLVEQLVAGLDVYRTYITADGATPHDAALLATLLGQVRLRRPDLPAPLIDFVAAIFAAPATSRTRAAFVSHFQQLSTAVAAKAIEDTAFYRYNRCIALNEVGASPAAFSVSVDEFHDTIRRWQAQHPEGMRSTTTHDSKRAEDVRARLTVLADRPEWWMALVEGWKARSDAFRIDGQPDRNFEYYLYQTLVGAWPLSRERAHTHIEKAMREAKVFTNWLTPSQEYERAAHHFVDGLYDDAIFTGELSAAVDTLHPADWTKCLAQLLLKLMVPGLPDLYQGSELWSLQLCDPDNRAAVDYAARQALLDACADLTAPQAMARLNDGVPKLWMLMRALALKARRPEATAPGAPYVPLSLSGTAAAGVVGFVRGGDVAVVVPTRAAPGDWADARVHLPSGIWADVFTGTTLAGGDCALHDVFEHFPVALLERIAPL